MKKTTTAILRQDILLHHLIGSVQMANERTVIDVVPEWFRDLFFIFLGVLVMCGLILAVAIMVGIVRAIIADHKKGRGS